MVESSLVKTVCSDCSCGFCCFFSSSDFPGFMLDAYEVITDKNDEYNTKVLKEVPKGSDLSKIVRKYFSERLDKKGDAYFTKLNKNIKLLIDGWSPIYACSLLDVEVKNGAAERLSCLIYKDNSDSDLRNHTCKDFKPGLLTPCFPTLKANVSGIEVDGNIFKLNDKVLALIESYSFS